MPRIQYRNRIRLTTESMSPLEKLLYMDRRARRPTILRPYHTECVVLRSDDNRIAGQVAGWRTDRRTDAGQGGRGYRLAAHGLERETAKRIGLEKQLAILRRGGRKLEKVEVVWIDGEVVERVCGWPELPADCSTAEACGILGVSRGTIYRWVQEGKLVMTKVANTRRGAKTRMAVSYRTRRGPLKEFLGDKFMKPERWHRVMMEAPDERWAASRFRGEGRRECVVRVSMRTVKPGDEKIGTLAYWVCPTCGYRGRHLFLPAGAMAKEGLTWSRWSFQCRWCTGVLSEKSVWEGETDSLGRTLLKMTAGRMSGNEWRQMWADLASGRLSVEEIMGDGSSAGATGAGTAKVRRSRKRRR